MSSEIRAEENRNQNQQSSSSSSSLILSLPEDLLMHCIALVPKHNYRNLSFVCKLFRSIVTSPDLFAKRSLLKCTESLIYVPIHDFGHHYTLWYTLIRDNATGCYSLAPITSLPRMPSNGGYVAFGSKIFAIGGLKGEQFKPDVSVIDCRFDIAQPFGRMPEVVNYPVVSEVIDGKMYVVGGQYRKQTRKPRMLMFDMEAKRWEYDMKRSGLEGDENRRVSTSVTMDGKVYARGLVNSFVFEPKEGKWEEDESLHSKWGGHNGCVIDEILYNFDRDDDCLRAYDLKQRLCCGVVKGVEGLAKYGSRASMVSYCDDKKKKKILLFLGTRVVRRDETKIWCAEIALMEKNENGEIWGNVEWCQLVLEGGDVFYENCLTVTV